MPVWLLFPSLFLPDIDDVGILEQDFAPPTVYAGYTAPINGLTVPYCLSIYSCLQPHLQVRMIVNYIFLLYLIHCILLTQDLFKREDICRFSHKLEHVTLCTVLAGRGPMLRMAETRPLSLR
jgi:hypothetical protein